MANYLEKSGLKVDALLVDFVETEAIAGTGKGGRLTKADVLGASASTTSLAGGPTPSTASSTAKSGGTT